MGDIRGQLEQGGLAEGAGIYTHGVVDRQTAGGLGLERIEPAAQITAKGQMAAGTHEGGVSGHQRVVGAVQLGDMAADSRVMDRLRVGARLGQDITRLEDGIGFVVAAVCIERADDGKTVEHGSQLGQVLTHLNAGQASAGDSKGATVLDRPVGFGVEGIDVAGTTGQPEQYDTFAGSLSRGHPLGLASHEVGQGQPADACQASLQKITAGTNHQPLAGARVQELEGMV